MNPSKMYVPDPQKWVDYFKKVAEEKINFNQTGGGKILSIEDGETSEQNPKANELVFDRVTPVQMTVNQAKAKYSETTLA